jgi:hypothetical protein
MHPIFSGKRYLCICLCAAALAGVCLPLPAQAQQSRVRGAVESATADSIAVKTAAGETRSVRIASALTVTSVTRASLADITTGTFIGTAAVPAPDGRLRALEIHIFPESMRGTGEGHRPYEPGGPQSTMTNATIDSVVQGVDGQTLMLTYKGGQQRVVVTPETPIVLFAPGSAADVVVGAQVVLTVQQGKDGPETTRALVGRDGFKPPL